MNRKIIALAVIWLIATIAVPYSHIFSLSVNGFSSESAGLAWASTERHKYCSDPKDRNKYQCIPAGEEPAEGFTCGGGIYEDSSCANYYLCINDAFADRQKAEIYCKQYNCGSGTRRIISEADVPATFSDDHFISESACASELASLAAKYDKSRWDVKKISSTSYTVEEISSDECARQCNGRNIGSNTVATGGGCAETPPSTAGGTVVATALTTVKCPLSPDGKAQRCYCVGVNPQGTLAAINTITQSRTYSVGTTSIPGTAGLVDDPEQIKNPKTFAANDVDCSLPTKVSINATISAAAVPVGASVTVSGEVAKFSDACNGVSYTCRFQYQKNCRVEQGFLRTCVVYNSCNTGDKVIMQQGASCSWNWFQIIGLVLLAVSVFGAFQSVKKGLEGTTQAGKAAATTTSVLAKLESVFGKNIGQVAIQLMQRSQQVYVPDGCNSICGRNEGTTAIAATPLCRGYAVEQNVSHYRCRLTNCGGFESKDVTIEVRDASNKIVRSDTTATDATGFYSFSFPAPSPAGSYSIVVSTEDPKVATDIVNVTSTR
ncbi:MAG: hypothetical protein HYW26_06000 [Candidatus Aenigmarchaeota archaeon]|nr:hypothetical protein [Candidatus Aenigmarchaeota archaeon]